MCYKVCNELLNTFLFTGNEIASSLPLQMSLYFNVIFFPVWLITIVIMLQLKVNHSTCTRVCWVNSRSFSQIIMVRPVWYVSNITAQIQDVIFEV
jgi:hypothetical protein